MSQSASRHHELQDLKEQRKQGRIDVLGYYRGLLAITARLMTNLQQEDISEAEAKKQVPLILVFLEEQIGKMANREV